MTYTLETCKGENKKQSFGNPSSEVIDQGIDELITAIYHFVILEAEPPIEKCSYVQALIEREGRFNGQYLVETRYLFAGDFKHYRMHTRDVAEVKKIFEKLASGIAPNVAGWDDITEKLTAAAG